MSVTYLYDYKIEIEFVPANKDRDAFYSRTTYMPYSDEIFRTGYWSEKSEEACIERAKKEVSDYCTSLGVLEYFYESKYFFVDTLYGDMQQQFVCKGHPFFVIEKYNKEHETPTYLKSWREITEAEYVYYDYSF